MSKEVDKGITDHAYSPDDIVLGNRGLTDAQLPALHELLDVAGPGWRSLFDRPVHEQWRLDRLKKWGPNSPLYESRMLDTVTSEREDELRGLLSYCRDQVDIYGKQFDDDRAAAYEDVVGKLAQLLDGEN